MKESKRIRYSCSVCKKEHPVNVPLKSVKNSHHFPVTYFTLHKYQGDLEAHPELSDVDVLARLYIDQNFHVRGAEAYLLDSSENIMAQKDAEKLISFLTNHILELQTLNEELMDKLVNEK